MHVGDTGDDTDDDTDDDTSRVDTISSQCNTRHSTSSNYVNRPISRVVIGREVDHRS